MKEQKVAAIVTLLGIGAAGAVAYATRRLWLPSVKDRMQKGMKFLHKEEAIKIPALNPRYDIAEEAQLDEDTLKSLDLKVREFFKAVVQKTKGECLMNPVIVCESKYDQPQVEVPETENTANFIEIIIAEGERIFKREAQYLGTKIVF